MRSLRVIKRSILIFYPNPLPYSYILILLLIVGTQVFVREFKNSLKCHIWESSRNTSVYIVEVFVQGVFPKGYLNLKMGDDTINMTTTCVTTPSIRRRDHVVDLTPIKHHQPLIYVTILVFSLIFSLYFWMYPKVGTKMYVFFCRWYSHTWRVEG